MPMHRVEFRGSILRKLARSLSLRYVTLVTWKQEDTRDVDKTAIYLGEL